MVGLVGRVAELRRQRLVHALPVGRRRLPRADAAGRRRLHARAPVRLGAAPPLGTRPARGAQAALQAGRALLQADAAGPERRADRSRPVRRQIRKQLRVFVALLFLLVGSLGLGRLHPVQPALLPARLGAGARHRLLRGQGRAADRPGGRAGPGADGEHRRRQGRRGRQGERSRTAAPSCMMRIQDKYKPIYRDATRAAAPEDRPQGHVPRARPRHDAAPATLPEGGRVTVANTLPDVNADEILAAARRRHARLPAHPAERGRHRVRRPRDRRGTRFQQTAEQDLREALQALRADRARRRALHAPADRAPAQHQARDPQLPAALDGAGAGATTSSPRFVDSANANFQAFASEEDVAARGPARVPERAVADRRPRCARPARSPTSSGPALQRLRPFARELAPALRKTRPFFRETTPIIRDQIRPFARDVQPTVRDLRQASDDLAVGHAAPDAQLQGAEHVLQHARLQPARRDRAVPVLERLGRARGRDALVAAGRARAGPARHRARRLPHLQLARADRDRATRSSACRPSC